MPRRSPVPSARARRGLRAGLAVLLLDALLVAYVAAPGPAVAATGAPPVTAPDSVTLRLGRPHLVDVLANDVDPDGDALAVCRLGPVPDGLLVDMVQEEQQSGFVVGDSSRRTGQLQVFAAEPGTYTVTYYACDFSSLVPGTLTVRVDPPAQVRVRVVKVPGHPGQLKVINRSGFRVKFGWGRFDADKADGLLSVGRRPLVFSVRRHSVFWVAGARRTSDFKTGSVRGIVLPSGTHVLPPGAPDRGQKRAGGGPSAVARPQSGWLR